ncbi:OmpA family protein [Psychromonas aquimarina]|uniref:OmpA family protein n=1 Tax=Psychromonas aquimarina TaxID=444919 RepID=UPI00040D067C|nr:OmpA family protein [Psychromonas aquimarina]
MINSIKLSIVTGVVMGYLSVANAKSANPSEKIIQGAGWWTGATIGLGVMDDLDYLDNNSNNANFFKLDLGYGFTQNLDLYAAYDYSDNYYGAKLHGVQFGVQGNYYLTDSLSLFGRVAGGYLINDLDETNSLSDFSEDTLVLISGFGLEYQLTPAVSTRLGYEFIPAVPMAQYADNTSTSEDVDLHEFYWGLSYHFGQSSSTQIVRQEVEVIKEVEVIRDIQNVLDASYIIPFKLGQAQLSDYARFSLDEVVRLMSANPQINIELTGRTDNSGSQTLNIHLSSKRAYVVADYLISQGVDKNRLIINSVSNTQPLSNGQPSVERSVEISFRHTQTLNIN